VESGLAPLALQGVFARRFFSHLDPNHTPPHNLMFMRIVRLLELAFYREYGRLIDDNVLWLGSGFASTNSDFYKNPERRESYGCIVANMSALQYSFKGDRKLFVSKKTLNEGAGNLLACANGVLAQCETVNSFKKFDGAHTGYGIGAWLAAEHESKGLLPNYVGYHCTDGASNAVASANEYEVLTEINRGIAFSHQKCYAHQANRSAKFASGTGDFKENKNTGLGEVLMKAHSIIARVHRSSARMAVIEEVQKAAGRKHILPSPAVTTRWDSANREVASLNRIMGDFNAGLHKLIKGIDKDKLQGPEGQAVPVSNFTFTANDRMILRQFECGSEPCLKLSKYYQIKDATSHETLFVTKAYLALVREKTFNMYDVMTNSAPADLKSRSKSVYVLSSVHEKDSIDMEGTDSDVSSSNSRNEGRNETPMNPSVELFRMLYADDMEKRCGFTVASNVDVMRLPTEISIACLLNPLYGGKSCAVLTSCCNLKEN
jgi:hypothetical protein